MKSKQPKPLPFTDTRPMDHYKLELPRAVTESRRAPARALGRLLDENEAFPTLDFVLGPGGSFEFMAANDVEAVTRVQKYIFARGLSAGSLRLFRSPSIEIPL